MLETSIASHFVHDADIEAKWRIEDERRMADRAFLKARRRAYNRRLRTFLGFEAKAAAIENPRCARFDVDISDIAGFVFEGGSLEESSLVEGIPALPRKLIKAWRSAYADFVRGEDDEAHFAFRIADGSLYLEGGPLALLRLELLRSRGELRVRGIASGKARVPRSGEDTMTEAEDARCEEPACCIAS